MQINKVAIIGAGAVGAYFVWGLGEKLGENLWVVAEGERKLRLESEGLYINNKKMHICIKTPEEAYGADLLLIATKYGALQEALDMAEKIVTKDTIIMSLLNGVTSEEEVSRRFGKERVVYSLMKIATERVDNRVVFEGETVPGVYYGEADRNNDTAHIRAIQELFEGTPIHHHLSEDIIYDMWCKFAHNVSMNLPQAVIGCGIGFYEDSEYASRLSAGLKAEVVAIAKAQGIDISSPPPQKGSSDPSARYSTLQDLDAKRHTEVDIFAGAVVEIGKKYGIETPYNAVIYDIIKTMEQKNDGRFDY